MRVVADSHVLVWYLTRPERLTGPALEALSDAEVAERYEDVPYPDVKDPFDRIIVATAWAAAVPLVMADRASGIPAVPCRSSGKAGVGASPAPAWRVVG